MSVDPQNETLLTWIAPGIAIGAVTDVDRAVLAGVTAILSLVGLPPAMSIPADVDQLCVPLTDGHGNSQRDVRRAVDYLLDFMRDREPVFVHCHAGRSRSVVILAIALMEHHGISRGAALSMISRHREIALTPGIESMFRFAVHG